MMQQPWWKHIDIRSFFRSGEVRRNPSLVWKCILGFFGVGLTAVLVVSYVMYYQSIGGSVSELSQPSPRSSLRSSDVKTLIDVYSKKKESFGELLSHQPTYPSPEKGAVVQLPVKAIEGSSTAPETVQPREE